MCRVVVVVIGLQGREHMWPDMLSRLCCVLRFLGGRGLSRVLWGLPHSAGLLFSNRQGTHVSSRAELHHAVLCCQLAVNCRQLRAVSRPAMPPGGLSAQRSWQQRPK
jgi:hypothetical protein